MSSLQPETASNNNNNNDALSFLQARNPIMNHDTYFSISNGFDIDLKFNNGKFYSIINGQLYILNENNNMYDTCNEEMIEGNSVDYNIQYWFKKIKEANIKCKKIYRKKNDNSVFLMYLYCEDYKIYYQINDNNHSSSSIYFDFEDYNIVYNSQDNTLKINNSIIIKLKDVALQSFIETVQIIKNNLNLIRVYYFNQIFRSQNVDNQFPYNVQISYRKITIIIEEEKNIEINLENLDQMILNNINHEELKNKTYLCKLAGRHIGWRGNEVKSFYLFKFNEECKLEYIIVQVKNRYTFNTVYFNNQNISKICNGELTVNGIGISFASYKYVEFLVNNAEKIVDKIESFKNILNIELENTK